VPLIAIGLGAISAGAILMIAFALTSAPAGERVQSRLNELGRREVQSLESIELEQPLFDRSIRPLMRRLSGLATRLSTASFASRTEKRLAIAGYPADMSVPDWLALKVISAGASGVLAAALFVLLHAPYATILLVSLLVGVIGYVAPEFWLGRRIRERQRLIVRRLPDSLDLLTISVRAGLGFDAALQRVVDKVPGPLSDEFRRALAEIRVGRQRRDALRAIVPRTDVRALTTFIGAILQAEQLGVPIARVLQIQSEQLRIDRRQRAEQSAAKAPVKMLFPLVGCILPALFVVILGPALILIATSLPG
jgi:tight adherence protein C